MRKQQESAFWSECPKQLLGAVQWAFQALPARYFLAAALLLPLATLAWACRLALGWAADRFVPQPRQRAASSTATGPGLASGWQRVSSVLRRVPQRA